MFDSFYFKVVKNSVIAHKTLSVSGPNTLIISPASKLSIL